MRDAIRSEILKARSGFWMLAVFAYALLMPALLLANAPKSTVDTSAVDAATGTHLLLGFLASCPVAAMFLGCWLVTREYYYKSVVRTVLANRRADVYLGKLIAGAAGGLAVGIVGAAGWAVIVTLVLRADTRSFVMDARTWQMLAGCVVACALAGPWGVAVGWIVPNYYVGTGIAILLPLGVELPLLLNYPDVARFLPATALAGIIRTPIDGVLPPVLGVLVYLPVLAAASWLGWVLFRRREVA
ncbi:hypothetical protein [Amycolatopsis sp. NPDC059021]|uniref:hypothetical protein n=1 Tax=Amycolatopsis sp. NPDC059021 TaxID=3346704 RepID=UPI0036706467